jgi:hypothetical protein
MKMQDLSSEILGSTRLVAASTKAPQQELLADTADPMAVDSSLQASLMDRQRQANLGAKERLHGNLASSTKSTLAQPGGHGSHSPGPGLKEKDMNVERRRREKNFSDLFGAQMGERRDIRGNREEILASRTTSVFDTRTEIASRNKEHWKQPSATAAASDRKEAERSSHLFDYSPPSRSQEKIQSQQADPEERACWDSREILHPSSEIARRRRMKDNRDIGEHHSQAHTALKQEQMASEQVSERLRLSASPSGGASARPQAAKEGPRVTFSSPRCGSPRAAPKTGYRSPRAPCSPSPRLADWQDRELMSARDTKLATLQSSIFT